MGHRSRVWLEVLILVAFSAVGMAWSARSAPAGIHYLETHHPEAEGPRTIACSFGPRPPEQWYSDRAEFAIYGVRPGMTLQEVVRLNGGPSQWDSRFAQESVQVNFGGRFSVTADSRTGVVGSVSGDVLEVDGSPVLRGEDTTDRVAEALGRGDIQGCRVEPGLRVRLRSGALRFQLESVEGWGDDDLEVGT